MDDRIRRISPPKLTTLGLKSLSVGSRLLYPTRLTTIQDAESDLQRFKRKLQAACLGSTQVGLDHGPNMVQTRLRHLSSDIPTTLSFTSDHQGITVTRILDVCLTSSCHRASSITVSRRDVAHFMDFQVLCQDDAAHQSWRVLLIRGFVCSPSFQPVHNATTNPPRHY